VVGSDDMHLRIFNYNTHEKLAAFEAHTDYIRALAVHPSQPFVLSSADDMLIKLWDWEKGWKNVMTFEGTLYFLLIYIYIYIYIYILCIKYNDKLIIISSYLNLFS
jgi:coatomer subunit beta'